MRPPQWWTGLIQSGHRLDCPNMATGVYRRGPYPCSCRRTRWAARWRRLLHVHRARIAGHQGPRLVETCRCGAARLVCIDGWESIAWTRWYPTAADAIAEATTLQRTGGRPSWRELWHRSGRAR